MRFIRFDGDIIKYSGVECKKSAEYFIKSCGMCGFSDNGKSAHLLLLSTIVKDETMKCIIDIDNEFAVILNAKDIQSLLKCSKKDANILMEQNDFPSLVVNGRYYVERDCFLTWLSKHSKEKYDII